VPLSTGEVRPLSMPPARAARHFLSFFYKEITMTLGLGLGFHARGNASAPPPPPFSPADITNLFAWYDSADAATITSSMGAVSQWNDKSGNNYHLTQGTGAKQPITGVESINAQNALDFNGAKVLAAPSGLYAIGGGNNTLFAVLSLDNTSADQRPISGSTASGTRYGCLFNVVTGEYGVINNTSFSPASQALSFNTNTHIIGLYRNGANVTGFYDGATTASAAAVNLTATSFFIGARNSTPLSGLDGQIAEIIVYNSLLTTDEMNDVGDYLSSKWGCTWAGL